MVDDEEECIEGLISLKVEMLRLLQLPLEQ
jgi:hypothetical protein